MLKNIKDKLNNLTYKHSLFKGSNIDNYSTFNFLADGYICINLFNDIGGKGDTEKDILHRYKKLKTELNNQNIKNVELVCMWGNVIESYILICYKDLEKVYHLDIEKLSKIFLSKYKAINVMYQMVVDTNPVIINCNNVSRVIYRKIDTIKDIIKYIKLYSFIVYSKLDSNQITISNSVYKDSNGFYHKMDASGKVVKLRDDLIPDSVLVLK